MAGSGLGFFRPSAGVSNVGAQPFLSFGRGGNHEVAEVPKVLPEDTTTSRPKEVRPDLRNKRVLFVAIGDSGGRNARLCIYRDSSMLL